MSIYTLRQAMMNENSGVPTIQTCKNIAHFWNADSLPKFGEWIDPVSGLHIIQGNNNGSPGFLSKSGNEFTWASGGLGVSHVEGSAISLSVTDDALFVLVGRPYDNSLQTKQSEENCFIRLGSSISSNGVMRFPSILYLDGSGIIDALGLGGNLVDDSGANFAAYGAYVRDFSNFYMQAVAIDRTNNLLKTYMWDMTDNASYNPVGGFTEADISTMSSVSPQLIVDASDACLSLNGRNKGTGWFKFPNKTLPQDWKAMSIMMAEAWMNGKYTFPPHWGYK